MLAMNYFNPCEQCGLHGHVFVAGSIRYPVYSKMYAYSILEWLYKECRILTPDDYIEISHQIGISRMSEDENLSDEEAEDELFDPWSRLLNN